MAVNLDNLEMERSWMYGKRNTLEYYNGVKKFCRRAKEHQKSTGDEEIYCPCRDCNTLKGFSNIKIIEGHLFRRGFRQAYHIWIWHGEGASSSVNDVQQNIEPENIVGGERNKSFSRGNASVSDIWRRESDESDTESCDNIIWDEGKNIVLGASSSLNDFHQKEIDESDLESSQNDVRNEDEDSDTMDETLDGVIDHFNQQGNTRGRRGRGPSKAVQVKEPMFLEYDDLGRPSGVWEHVYATHLGRCALEININVKGYRFLPEANKQAFWDKTKALFHIEDGPKKEKEKLFHSGLNRRFSNYRTKLASRWITKTRKPPLKSAHLMPWELYKGFITKKDWKKFEANRTTDEAKAISEKARKSALQNKHPHRLGQKSYKRSKEQWIKDGRYPDDTDGSSSKIAKRGLEWIMAREKLGEGGNWVITNEETQKVAKKYEDYMQQQAQGTFVPHRNMDALCMALGKKDHSGRLSGVGGLNIGHKKVFGKPDRKFTELFQNQQSMETIKDAIKASLMEDFEQKLNDHVEMRVKQELASIMQQNGGPKYPEGTNLPQTTAMLLENEGATSDREKGESKSNEKVDGSNRESGESATNVIGPLQLVGEDILASDGEESKLLHLQHIMESQSELYGVTTVLLDAEMFHLEKDTKTFVSAEDMTLLLRGERVNISIIQVFMMFLIDKYFSSLDLLHIGFLCPQTIAASNVHHHLQVTADYMRDVFLSSKDRGDAGYRLILAPYYEEEHWMLIVINLTCGKVFKFDSSKPNKGRSLTIKDCLDIAYSGYNVQGRKGRSSKLKWFSIECAQQTGCTESGYYVMKFMHEIVTLYNDCQNMEREYQRRDKPYSDEEIIEVREQWAGYFGDKYL